jgi:hypothetical protein
MPPTPLETLLARQLLTYLEQILEPTLFPEAQNPVIPEPQNLPPTLQAHLNVLKNPNAARPAKIAALRALFKIKGGQEP